MPAFKMTVRVINLSIMLCWPRPNTDLVFYFPCFNTEDPQDPTVGLINGELCVPGNLLRREVFDPVVNEVFFQLHRLVSPKFRPDCWGFAINRRTDGPYWTTDRCPTSRRRFCWEWISQAASASGSSDRFLLGYISH